MCKASRDAADLACAICKLDILRKRENINCYWDRARERYVVVESVRDSPNPPIPGGHMTWSVTGIPHLEGGIRVLNLQFLNLVLQGKVL